LGIFRSRTAKEAWNQLQAIFCVRECNYPRELIPEHWKFYYDQPVDAKILDIEKADLAL